MKITFKQVDDQHMHIMSGEKKIGHIFSPAGTGETTPNAIQVCGFEDAYDLWGCGVFSEKVEEFEPYTEEALTRAKTLIKEGKQSPVMLEMYKNMVKRGGNNISTTVYKKDIQLLFKEYNNAGHDNHQNMGCYGCYNKKCSCDDNADGNIYKVKRANDPEFKKKLEEKCKASMSLKTNEKETRE